MNDKRMTTLALGATGVVFGDIGTSPLYTLRECFAGTFPLEPTSVHVLGVLSLIFWSILIVVSVKYVSFVMRADNQGEGGIMALMALAARAVEDRPRASAAIIGLGLIGGALFYGDGMITPAISVLSAVEGLEVATPAFKPFVIPISLAVIVVLFVIQSQGTEKVGRWFGPIMVVWFLVLGGLGLWQIAQHPRVLHALTPVHAIALVGDDPMRAFLLLGSVVLALTGGEALYADMGHFGKAPIRASWFSLVLPALVLNYFGQGALLLEDPTAISNPFYRMAPDWALYPMVLMSTVATVIASQAVISGAFSMTRQAIQLGFCPRLAVDQTSEHEIGQIYVPWINWVLLAAVAGLVLGFRSSSNLAAAYGIAVTGTMLATTVMALIVARTLWRWSLPACVAVGGLFLTTDGLFFAANTVKIHEGGWFPLVIAAIVYLLMTTWKKGKRIVSGRLGERGVPLRDFITAIVARPPTRVAGTAVFLSRDPDAVPTALLHNLKHNMVLHQRVVFVTVHPENVPRLPDSQRCTIDELGQNFYRVTIRFGFMEITDVPRALQHCATAGLEFEMMRTSFFISRETLIPTPLPGMAIWRERLFAAMARNAASATDFFHILPDRAVELGTQIEI